MKKSVNGKSFDEIFSERGTLVTRDDFTKSSVYFFDGEKDSQKSISPIIDISNTSFYFDFELFGDGLYHKEGAYILGSKVTAFTATPNQIDLLNAYKQP